MKKYNPQEIEKKWQEKWERERVFESDHDLLKKKFYLLEMFPYPSGKIHMGHVRNYSIGDAVSRYLLMKGYNLLHPMGWDAFGLPAENAAIAHKQHPGEWTYKNIEYMKEQLKRLGYSYDWRREVTTCDPQYYRWEQEFFIKMFEKNLVYRKETLVNFCPDCNTVLANEQVVNGRCWRCDTEVEIKKMPGWFFKITAYAEELLKGIEELRGKWPEKVLIMQENWIGKSSGLEAEFPVKGSDHKIKFFTTRPDTIYGISFMALAPEHPDVERIAKLGGKEKEVKEFVGKSIKNKISGKIDETYEKEGIFTGAYCINPFTDDEVPIYVANFVLIEYGTGAIMCVPAHDSRDFEFAKKYNLPIKLVIQKRGEKLNENNLKSAWEGEGYLVNSGPFNSLPNEEAKEKIIEYSEKNGIGKRAVKYRLKDWGISRQRYWGAPIPVIYCEKCGTLPVPIEQLPVSLPENVKITGKGRSPLEDAEEFIKTSCPECGGEARRETDTMDTFVESSWYFLRFASLFRKNVPFARKEVDYWLPVDLYIGGIEHAVLHLLYARFFTKVLRDLGYIDFSEPFTRLLTQGMVLKDGAKMSKSKGNVVDPGDIIDKYGADAVRIFILFASPPEKDLEWSDETVEGMYRFLQRIWNLFNRAIKIIENNKSKEKEISDIGRELNRAVNLAVKNVTAEFESRLHLNKCISELMILLNEMVKIIEKSQLLTLKDVEELKEGLKTFALLLTPFAPHLSEELWKKLGEKSFISRQNWPSYRESIIEVEKVKIAVQINGRVRDEIEIEKKAGQQEALNIARESEKVKKYIEGKEVVKVIYVPAKILNIVIKD